MLTKTFRGFTIVELMIVIVVIGIIAAISVVSYNGAQPRTRNAQTAQAVRAYKDALIMYLSIHKQYPVGNINEATCLGDEYPTSKCWMNNIDENASFTAALNGVVDDSLPMPAVPNIMLKGAYFNPANRPYPVMVDGKPTNIIGYSIEGSNKCPVGPVLSDDNDGNVLTWSSVSPASGQTVAATSTNPVQCYIALPAFSR